MPYAHDIQLTMITLLATLSLSGLVPLLVQLVIVGVHQ